MKTLSISILVFFISCYTSAQDIFIDDSFDDNKNEWEFKSNEFNCSIKKGKLEVKNESKDMTKWFLKNTKLNTDKIDFDVEATFRLVKTKNENATYGLVWSGYNDNSYYDVVQIGKNKRLQLYRYQKNKFNNYKKWHTEESLSKEKKENHIKVIKRANIFKIFINKKLVYQTGSRVYFGSKFGFIVDAKTTIEVDDFKLVTYSKSIDVVDSFDSSLKVEKLPETVSKAKSSERAPVISADGNTLYVTRDKCDDNIFNSKKSEVWYSKKVNDKWTELKNFGKPINNDGYNFVVSIAPDNNSMLVANTYNEDGTPATSGISITRKTENGWQIPQKMVIDKFENKNKFVGYFLANDNKHLLIAIEKEGTYGKKDIYVSFLKDENNWSEPLNLGNVVNTFEEETNPFLASDGKTLYFTSKGHYGYGAFDLFVSKRLDDSWTNWSKPKNLGNIINSTGYDLSYVLSAKGDIAYLSRDGDIYEIKNTVAQDPVALIKGKVFDAKTKKVLSAPIVYNNLKTNKELGKALSDQKTGEYSIVLPYGEQYSFMAEKEGYYAITENVDLSNLSEYKEVEVNLYLNPIEKGQTIRLNNIFFESAKYELLKESFAELDKLFNILKGNKKIKIEIAGHTDAVGSNQSNMLLSKNRAKAVMDYLLEKGISKERLSFKGYGETKFIADNDTEKGKSLNRRVEFVIKEL